LTHHRAKRDGRGRFVKARPVNMAEQQAAQQAMNQAGGGGAWLTVMTLTDSNPTLVVTDADVEAESTRQAAAVVKELAARHRARIRTELETAANPKSREVPIEYATPRHLIRWEVLGWSAIVLVVVVAIWVMTH
jgi:hypothetical protein